MCGIAGKVNFGGSGPAPDRDVVTAMIAQLRHRGPDALGLYVDDHACLASARLSIVDIAGGTQPIGSPDGSLWVVFNGEVFNHVELRRELEARGRAFRTRSDTEVVLAAFEQWGPSCFERLNGQWAVAIWDRLSRRLVLARDPVGICPLFVRRVGDTVWFASEVKALFADPVVPRAIDPRGIDQTFTYWAPLAPITIFRGIDELRPGSWRSYGAIGGFDERVYWSPSFPARNSIREWNVDEATEALSDALATATRLRAVRSDVPVGCYLSGGLDSSLIARLGRTWCHESFTTFSLRFDDPEFDEHHFQQLMVSQLGSDHHEVVVRRADIAAVFPDVIRHTERPVLRSAPAPMFLLSRAVRAHGIKAVLTGEGADEALAGYDLFREAKIREFWARQPESTIRPLLFERIYPYLARSPRHARRMSHEFWRQGLELVGQPGFSHLLRWTTTSMLKRLLSDTMLAEIARNPPPDHLASLPNDFTDWHSLSQAQYLEITTLLSPYLLSSQSDRMLMAHSVEGRFPYLDPNVLELCSQLPASFKLRHLDEKYLLKQVARDVLPSAILERKKQPYRAPDAVCFLGSHVPDYVTELLSETALAEAGIFEPRVVRKLVEKCQRAVTSSSSSVQLSNHDNMALMGVISTQLVYHLLLSSPHPCGELPSFDMVVDMTEHEALRRSGHG